MYWCAADVGWVTGHSYIVYGPLCNGATSVMWEGAPDYPSKGIWWEIVERYGVSDPVLRADGDPRVHQVGRAAGRTSTTCRSLRLLGLGGRADQPEGVAVVPQGDRRRTLPDRGHVVADGDGRDHDHAAAGDHRDEAGLGDAAVPGGVRGGARRVHRRADRGGPGPARADASVAVDAAHALQGGRALHRDLLQALRPRDLPRGRRRQARRATATSG